MTDHEIIDRKGRSVLMKVKCICGHVQKLSFNSVTHAEQEISTWELRLCFSCSHKEKRAIAKRKRK